MSDRIAVFNAGRIEQVGSPADVYERPATEFVAGFVGTSNLLRGESARAILGQEGTFSVRPEKIYVADPDEPLGRNVHSAPGVVREVVYVGSGTRFVVDLDVGGSLVALQQNQQTSSSEVMAMRGRPVRLAWQIAHEYRVDEASTPAGD